MNQEPSILTNDLTKTYDSDVPAVRGLNLVVHSGEIYGFLGPNGAGKTTTLRMLLGLVRPSAGRATVLGKPSGHPAALARTGSLIESAGFFPYLSGRDNLRVLAYYNGILRSSRSLPKCVDAALELVKLSDRANSKYSKYSLGMKQRLGVAAALLKQPELLILDEPTNGLDPAGMRDMRTLISDLGAAGHTVLLSSHLLGDVEQVCDRVGVISHGSLVVEGTVEEMTGQTELLVDAEPLDRARDCAEQLLGEQNVHVNDRGLRISAPLSEAHRINRAMVAADIVVHELRAQDRSLEQVFLEITDTENGHAA